MTDEIRKQIDGLQHLYWDEDGMFNDSCKSGNYLKTDDVIELVEELTKQHSREVEELRDRTNGIIGCGIYM